MRPPNSSIARAASLLTPASPKIPNSVLVQCTMMLLLAVNHLLADDPRHVRYRDTLSEEREASVGVGPQSMGSISHHRSRTRSPEASEPRRCHARPASPCPRPHTLNQDWKDFPNDYKSAARARPESGERAVTGARKSEAWTRIRAVSRHQTRPKPPNAESRASSVKAKAVKNVRWGPVRVHEHEPEYEAGTKSPDKRYTRNSSGDNVGDASKSTTRDNGMGLVQPRDSWAPVNTSGEHETWGPIAGSDGQFE